MSASTKIYPASATIYDVDMLVNTLTSSISTIRGSCRARIPSRINT